MQKEEIIKFLQQDPFVPFKIITKYGNDILHLTAKDLIKIKDDYFVFRDKYNFTYTPTYDDVLSLKPLKKGDAN